MRKAMTTFVRSSGQNSAVQSVLTSNKAYIGLSDTATEVLDLFPCSLVVVFMTLTRPNPSFKVKTVSANLLVFIQGRDGQ